MDALADLTYDDDGLIPAIIQTVASAQEEINRFSITLTHLSTYKQFRVFRDFLRREVTGVKSVRQTRVRKNSVSIVVEFQGGKDRFFERVLTHENLPFSLSIDQAEEEIVFIVGQ